MPRPKQKTKSQDLARIRNNQQRCRQRRCDYVTELEARIAEYESSSERKVAMLQASIDELRKENGRLRGLLGDVDASGWGMGGEEGIDTPSAATTIETGAGRTGAGISEEESQTRTISMSDIHPRTGLGGNGAELSPGAALSQSSKIMPLGLIGNQSYCSGVFEPLQWTTGIPPSPSSMLCGISTDLTTPNLNNNYPPNTLGESTCCSQPDWLQWLSTTPADIQPSGNTVQETDTTLCTAAFGLVMRCNKRNASIGEIEAKLRCGYRSAVFQWEGCRVENRVLLAVLSEIA